MHMYMYIMIYLYIYIYLRGKAVNEDRDNHILLQLARHQLQLLPSSKSSSKYIYLRGKAIHEDRDNHIEEDPIADNNHAYKK